MFIGITGTIGSGKSYVTNHFKEFGFKVFSSDEIVKQAYEDKKIQEQLIAAFGSYDKKIIKEKLNNDNINILNNIIHPYVINYLKKLKNLKNEKIIVEVPLLFEINLESYFDYTIAIKVDERIRNERLRKRNESQYEFLKKLEKNQFSEQEKIAKANYVIDNSSDEKNIVQQISKIVALL